jgi:hypothetical protein
MEPVIYNRKNENIAVPAYVAVDKRFRFSQGAINLIGMKAGRFLHLLQFGENDWYFMVDDDPLGLRLGLEGTHIVAHAVKVCRLFIAKSRSKLEQGSISFYIEETEKEYKGKMLWRVNLERRFISKRKTSTS